LKAAVCFLFVAALLAPFIAGRIFPTDCSHPTYSGPKLLLLTGSLPAFLAFGLQFFVSGRHRLIRAVGILALLLSLLELVLSYYSALAIGIGCND
jgi:hypothetical protein